MNYSEINSISDITVWVDELIERYHAGGQDIKSWRTVIFNYLYDDLILKLFISGEYNQFLFLLELRIGQGQPNQIKNNFFSQFVSRFEDGSIQSSENFKQIIQAGLSVFGGVSMNIREVHEIVREPKEDLLNTVNRYKSDISQIQDSITIHKSEISATELSAKSLKGDLVDIVNDYQKSIGEVATKSIGKYFWQKTKNSGRVKNYFNRNREIALIALFGEILIPIILFKLFVFDNNSSGLLGFIFTSPTFFTGIFGMIIILTYLVVHFNTKNYYFYQSIEEDYGLRTVISNTYPALIGSINSEEKEVKSEVTREMTKRLFEPINQRTSGDSDFTTPLMEIAKSLRK